MSKPFPAGLGGTVFRVDSILMYEGADNTWLLEANFLGYEGRRVHGVLLHFQADDLTEVRPKMARVSDKQVIRPAAGCFPTPTTPEALKRRVAAVLEALGWGPEATSPAMWCMEAWPPSGRRAG